MNQYERCSDALKRQLHLQPEPETRELYVDLRARRTISGASPRKTRGSVSPSDTLQSSQTLAEHLQVGVQTTRPPTHYVKSAGTNIAYQVTGAGPIDIVYVPGWVSNLDLAWQSPRLRMCSCA
ncbi:MAG: hypothetical protein E5Y59_23260, partial [Mesorhizobium sp.]